MVGRDQGQQRFGCDTPRPVVDSETGVGEEGQTVGGKFLGDQDAGRGFVYWRA